MNLPLRLSGCSLRVSLVGVVYLRIVRCVFRWWMWCICGLFVVCFVVWMLRYSNLFAIFWQFVSSCRGRFIVPAYPYTPTKCGTKMYVRWNKCTYLIMWICVFYNVRIRARWICPYACWSVRCEFRWREWCICGVFIACFVGECGIFAECSQCISLRECCIIIICL